MHIRLKKGSRVKSDAETIFKAVEAAKDACGNVELQTLVDQARPKNAPLHQEFTWTNREAAEKWRLHEARQVVKSIEVVHDNSKPTRAWESVTVVQADVDTDEPPIERRVFRSVEDIMSDPAQRSELLIQAMRDAVAWRKRYGGLQELAQIHQAIDEVVVKQNVA